MSLLLDIVVEAAQMRRGLEFPAAHGAIGVHSCMETDLSPLLEGLTGPQRLAVEHADGPLLVLAGPGSGKTTVVTRRIANLIGMGVPAWQILALTFTNKAAGEMRDRVDRLVPDDLPGRRGLTVATFHSFCARLLRRYAEVAGLEENYTIYPTADQREAIKTAIAAAGLDSKNWTPASVAAAISNAKNQLLDASACAAEAFDYYTRSIAKIYKQYEKILKQNHAVDFDDLLLFTAKLIRDHEPVRSELQDRYRYLLIDEYQDTNYAQFLIAHSLAAKHRNICVVGDPDQSIYGWRGADIRNIMEFEEHYPEAAIVPLGQNFRSTGHIVAAADALIRRNRNRKHKDLHTELGKGEKPTVVTCRDEHEEAALIVDEFRKRREQGIPWKEMAVLYRVNALSRVLEEAFRSAHIPYLIARGTAFYDRKEIKDALAYLRVVSNPNDEVSLKRIINTPSRGIGKTTLEKLEIYSIQKQISLFEALRRAEDVRDLSPRAVRSVQKFAAMILGWRAIDASAAAEDATLLPQEIDSVSHQTRAPLAELVERMVRESGMEAQYRSATMAEERERLDNLVELINAAAEFEPAEEARSLLPTLTAFLESVALVSDADAVDPTSGAVTLMTLHAAKGLEFDVVAMAGLERGLLPHTRSTDSEDELEEERRLCFVGMTRARRHLLLVRAATRAQRGYREPTSPSQFLEELPESSIVTLDLAGDRPRRSSADAHGGQPWPPRRRGARKGADERDADFIDDVPTIDAAGWSVGDREARFPVGCLVRHAKFGVGRVESLMPRPAGTSARISFHSAGVKTLFLEHAKLERIES